MSTSTLGGVYRTFGEEAEGVSLLHFDERETMLSDLLLPDSTRLLLADVEINTAENQIILHVHTTSTVSPCPLCEQESQRVHSYYTRHLSDLPCVGRCLQIQLQARKFFCDNSLTCTFEEKHPLRKFFTKLVTGLDATFNFFSITDLGIA